MYTFQQDKYEVCMKFDAFSPPFHYRIVSADCENEALRKYAKIHSASHPSAVLSVKKLDPK